MNLDWVIYLYFGIFDIVMKALCKKSLFRWEDNNLGSQPCDEKMYRMSSTQILSR